MQEGGCRMSRRRAQRGGRAALVGGTNQENEPARIRREGPYLYKIQRLPGCELVWGKGASAEMLSASPALHVS